MGLFLVSATATLGIKPSTGGDGATKPGGLEEEVDVLRQDVDQLQQVVGADMDADPSNELQTLSRDGSNVTLSHDGGTVSVNDDDADPTNELQSLDAVLTKGNDAGTKKITNLGEPISDTDAATKGYVDGLIGECVDGRIEINGVTLFCDDGGTPPPQTECPCSFELTIQEATNPAVCIEFDDSQTILSWENRDDNDATVSSAFLGVGSDLCENRVSIDSGERTRFILRDVTPEQDNACREIIRNNFGLCSQ